jgi:hypothetical protein
MMIVCILIQPLSMKMAGRHILKPICISGRSRNRTEKREKRKEGIEN